MNSVCQDYAFALFGLAKEQEADFSQDLALIKSIFTAEPGYVDLLASPAIPLAEREKALEDAFGSSVRETVLSFLMLLCREGHIRLWDECFDEYEALVEDATHRSVARIVSAVELSPQQLSSLQQQLEKTVGHSLTVECTTDATLLGGVTVYVDGKVLDGSLKHRLEDIKEVMNQ